MRQGDVEIEGKLGVTPALGPFDLIDGALKVVHPLRRTLGRIGAAPLCRPKVPVIPDLAGALINKPRAGEKQKEAVHAKRVGIDRKIRKLKTRKRTKTDRARVHAAIVVGLEIIEHALRNPGSEVRRVGVRIMDNHLTKRPEDLPVADTLAKLKAPDALPEAANAGIQSLS
jgi:hypothetical protein